MSMRYYLFYNCTRALFVFVRIFIFKLFSTKTIFSNVSIDFKLDTTNSFILKGCVHYGYVFTDCCKSI